MAEPPVAGTITTNDREAIPFRWLGPDGQPRDISADTIRFTARMTTARGTIVASKTSAGGAGVNKAADQSGADKGKGTVSLDGTEELSDKITRDQEIYCYLYNDLNGEPSARQTTRFRLTVEVGEL